MSAVYLLAFADTVPPPPPLVCVCGPVDDATFETFIRPVRWEDEDGVAYESRTCPVCICTLTRVVPK